MQKNTRNVIDLNLRRGAAGTVEVPNRGCQVIIIDNDKKFCSDLKKSCRRTSITISERSSVKSFFGTVRNHKNKIGAFIVGEDFLPALVERDRKGLLRKQPVIVLKEKNTALNAEIQGLPFEPYACLSRGFGHLAFLETLQGLK